MDETSLMTGTELVTVVGLLVSSIAAWAAYVAGSAAKRSAQIAEGAALLGAVPLLVPWISRREGVLKVKNRGHSDAHELAWRIVAGGETVASDSISTVIGANRSKNLTGPQDAIIAALRTQPEVVIKCEYLSSWGEGLTLERAYRRGVSQGFRLLDREGRSLSIQGSSA